MHVMEAAYKLLIGAAALAATSCGTNAIAGPRRTPSHSQSFDLTPYYGDHSGLCSGTGVRDPRDEQQTFTLKLGEIQITGHNIWFSKLRSTEKGATRSTALYFVNADSNTMLVFENNKLLSATHVDVVPDAHGKAMKVQTVCTFN